MVNLVVRVPKTWVREAKRQAKINGFESVADWHRNLLADWLTCSESERVKGVAYPQDDDEGADYDAPWGSS